MRSSIELTSGIVRMGKLGVMIWRVLGLIIGINIDMEGRSKGNIGEAVDGNFVAGGDDNWEGAVVVGDGMDEGVDEDWDEVKVDGVVVEDRSVVDMATAMVDGAEAEEGIHAAVVDKHNENRNQEEVGELERTIGGGQNYGRGRPIALLPWC